MLRSRTVAVPTLIAAAALASAPAAGAARDNVYVYRVTAVALHGAFTYDSSWGGTGGERGRARVEAAADVSWRPPSPRARPTRRSGAWVGWWDGGRFDGRLATRAITLRWAGAGHLEEQVMDEDSGTVGPARLEDCTVAFTERASLLGDFARTAAGAPAVAIDLPALRRHETCAATVSTRAITAANQLRAPRVVIPASRLRGAAAIRVPIDVRFASGPATLRYTGTIELRRAWSCLTPPEYQCNAELSV